MSTSIQIRISIDGDDVEVVDWSLPGPLILGRQGADEAIFKIQRSDHSDRLPITRRQDVQISRNQVRLERVDDGQIRICNLKPGLDVRVDSNPLAANGDGYCVHLPFTLRLGSCELAFQVHYQTLMTPTQFHRDFPSGDKNHEPAVLSTKPKDAEAETENLIAVLGQISSVLQNATTETELFENACKAIRSLINVDGAMLLRGCQFEQRFGDDFIQPVESVLEMVRDDRLVRWGVEVAVTDEDTGASGEVFYVAAPIQDDKQEVQGVLYAHRKLAEQETDVPFKKLHARLVELIACSVAAGQVRRAHDRAAGQMEQFFTPTLAKKLVEGNELLKPVETEITVLICDIREFSTISERLSPQDTSEWVQDVLSQLSEVVLQHDGVLVDYIGDELVAMWGAPVEQPDHARLGCICARDLVTRMPQISEKWREKIGAETRVGVGVNTGNAFVGNTGSTQKFKYGPLGDTVNRASRIQGLTKYLKVHALASGQTMDAIHTKDVAARRIGKARVVNIQEPINLFELIVDPDQDTTRHVTFERALESLECGQLPDAAVLIKGLLDFDNPDHPTLLLFNEIIQRVVAGDTHSDSTYEWTFDKK